MSILPFYRRTIGTVGYTKYFQEWQITNIKRYNVNRVKASLPHFHSSSGTNAERKANTVHRDGGWSADEFLLLHWWFNTKDSSKIYRFVTYYVCKLNFDSKKSIYLYSVIISSQLEYSIWNVHSKSTRGQLATCAKFPLSLTCTVASRDSRMNIAYRTMEKPILWL